MKEINKEDRIGFQIKNRELELILPAFIKDRNLSSEEKTKEKVKYFRLLRRYKRASKELKKEYLHNIGASQKEEYAYSIFEAYYLLFMDYMELGPFLFTERKTNTNIRGRINWQVTINKSSLLISNENIIYENLYYKNKNIQFNHPLTILYGLHLLEIEKATGLRLNIHGQYRSIIENNRKNINVNRILNDFRTNVYGDRERKVLKLLTLINDKKGQLDKLSSNANLYYLENLNNIWEVMLKEILDDEYSYFKAFFPTGEYSLEIEGKGYTRAGLRIIPDTIKEYNNKLYIIDAKNYLPHINKTLPGSGDINKQILYRYFLSKEFNSENHFELKKIENIFLLPNDLGGEVIKKIGNHKISNINNSLGDITLYQVDFNQVVDGYLDKDPRLGKEILEAITE